MHRHGFFLFLITSCGFTLLSAIAGEPQGQFWIVRAANDIADPLVEAVEGKKIPPDELASRITSLIDAKKIQQLARFNQVLGAEKILHKNSTGEMSTPDGAEKIDLGVIAEAEVTLEAASRKAHIRMATEIHEKKSRDEYRQKTLNSAQTIYGDHWELVGIWKDAKESNLVVARIADYPVVAEAEPDFPVTALQVELLEIQPADLVQFGKSTSATRPKAVAWLRGRSQLLAAMTTKALPGQMSAQEDVVANFAGERGGFTLISTQWTRGDGKKVDIKVTADWQDPEKPAVEEDYQFTVSETLEAGQPRLFEPSINRHPKGLLPVLVITPQVMPPKGHPQEIAPPRDPSTLPDKISTQIYPVASKFMRIMQGPEGLDKRLPLRETLVQRGLEFPPGTSVTVNDRECRVILMNNRDGHLKFMALLKELDLLP